MMIDEFVSYAKGYSSVKRVLGRSLGMTDDLLHVHLGLVIFVVTALLLRRRMRSVWPLGVVAAFTLINEVVDYLINDPWPAHRSSLDVVNSMFWPGVLFLLARRGPGVDPKL